MNGTLVVLPTYNERDNLSDAITRIIASVPVADILVVDDNSPDGTGELADAHALDDARVHVLHRRSKEGLGAAYLAAFDWALDRGYTVVIQCDADGSHRPEELPRLLAALDSADVVVGSRWVRGGVVLNWPLSRRLLSRGGSLYARGMLGLEQHDITGGYRAFRSSALRRMGLDSITSQGYCYQIEMLWRAHRLGLRIAEVPITFADRTLGTSKMRSGIAIEALLRVTQWGLLSASRAVIGGRAEPRPLSRDSRNGTTARTR